MEEDKREQTIEEAIDEAYNKLLDLICDRHDSLYELKIVYQEDSTGKTIIRSWIDRNNRLQESELSSRKIATEESK
jgi:hypothetical protein